MGISRIEGRVQDLTLSGFTALAMTSLILAPTLYGEISFLKRVVVLELTLLALYWLVRKKKQIYVSYFQFGAIIAVVASFASNSDLTQIKNFLAYLVIMVIALQIVAISSLSVIVTGIGISGLVSVFITLITLLVSPSNSWGPEGQLQGLYGHWNIFGMALVFSLPALLCIELSNKSLLYIFKVSATSLIFGFVLASRSSTSLIAFLVILAVWVIYIIYLKSPRLAVMAIASCFSVVLLSVISPRIFFQLLGKNEDLTGRVQIWESIINHSSDKWLNGFGWAPLFPMDSELYAFIAQDTGIGARHAHNDLLNWFALTGVIGFIAIIGYYALSIIGGTLVFKVNQNIRNVWIPLSAVGLFVQGSTESTSMTPQGWFIVSISLGILGVSNQKWIKYFYFPSPRKAIGNRVNSLSTSNPISKF